MCPLSVPLAFCSTRNRKEYDCPLCLILPLNPLPIFTLLSWPLTPGDVSERSRGQCLSVDGGSELREFWVMSEVRVCASVCLWDECMCACVCAYTVCDNVCFCVREIRLI